MPHYDKAQGKKSCKLIKEDLWAGLERFQVSRMAGWTSREVDHKVWALAGQLPSPLIFFQSQYMGLLGTVGGILGTYYWQIESGPTQVFWDFVMTTTQVYEILQMWTQCKKHGGHARVDCPLGREDKGYQWAKETKIHRLGSWVLQTGLKGSVSEPPKFAGYSGWGCQILTRISTLGTNKVR